MSRFRSTRNRIRCPSPPQRGGGRGGHLLGDYIEEELRRRERIVEETDSWAQVVPFWAVWPFETMLVPKRLAGPPPPLTPPAPPPPPRALRGTAGGGGGGASPRDRPLKCWRGRASSGRFARAPGGSRGSPSPRGG